MGDCVCSGAVMCTACRLELGRARLGREWKDDVYRHAPPKPKLDEHCECRRCEAERRREEDHRLGVALGASLVALAGWVQGVARDEHEPDCCCRRCLGEDQYATGWSDCCDQAQAAGDVCGWVCCTLAVADADRFFPWPAWMWMKGKWP